jgi:DNA repair protein RadA
LTDSLREEDNDPKTTLDLNTIEEIGPATKDRLEQAGFKSIKDLVVRGPIDVSESTGMEMVKSVYLCNKARIRLEDLGIID